MNTDIIENLPGEEWRPIKGYENLYCVSNKGRVKSLGKFIDNKYGSKTFRKEKILSTTVRKNHFYPAVCLTKNKETKTFTVHRLVAEAFIPNPDNKPCVNHKSERKTENNVENLEWVSYKENINWGTRTERQVKTQLNYPKFSKPIKCVDLQTNEITYYPSGKEAERQLKIRQSTIRASMYRYKSPYKNRYIFTEA